MANKGGWTAVERLREDWRERMIRRTTKMGKGLLVLAVSTRPLRHLVITHCGLFSWYYLVLSSYIILICFITSWFQLRSPHESGHDTGRGLLSYRLRDILFRRLTVAPRYGMAVHAHRVHFSSHQSRLQPGSQDHYEDLYMFAFVRAEEEWDCRLEAIVASLNLSWS